MPRKYSINENYFENLDSAEKVYWLGFITADGCLYQRKTRNKPSEFILELNAKDVEQVINFRNAIGCDKDLEFKHSITKNGMPTYACKLRIYNSEFIKHLNKWVPTNKSNNNFTPPDVPAKYINAFWAGVFDGDGCIYFRKNGAPTVCLTGSKPVVEAFKDRFNLDVSYAVKTNYSTIQSAKKTKVKEILGLFYKDDNLPSLRRKKKLALEVLNGK